MSLSWRNWWLRDAIMTSPSPLDENQTVAVEALAMPPLLDAFLHEWPTGEVLREEMYQRDLLRQAQPPVIHVTVAPPEGQAAVPGHFRVTTGPEQTISWSPEPDTEPVRKVLPVAGTDSDEAELRALHSGHA
jgi:hypothetical protein